MCSFASGFQQRQIETRPGPLTTSWLQMCNTLEWIWPFYMIHGWKDHLILWNGRPHLWKETQSFPWNIVCGLMKSVILYYGSSNCVTLFPIQQIELIKVAYRIQAFPVRHGQQLKTNVILRLPPLWAPSHVQTQPTLSSLSWFDSRYHTEIDERTVIAALTSLPCDSIGRNNQDFF